MRTTLCFVSLGASWLVGGCSAEVMTKRWRDRRQEISIHSSLGLQPERIRGICLIRLSLCFLTNPTNHHITPVLVPAVTPCWRPIISLRCLAVLSVMTISFIVFWFVRLSVLQNVEFMLPSYRTGCTNIHLLVLLTWFVDWRFTFRCVYQVSHLHLNGVDGHVIRTTLKHKVGLHFEDELARCVSDKMFVWRV
jgi:hypothetical protein